MNSSSCQRQPGHKHSEHWHQTATRGCCISASDLRDNIVCVRCHHYESERCRHLAWDGYCHSVSWRHQHHRSVRCCRPALGHRCLPPNTSYHHSLEQRFRGTAMGSPRYAGELSYRSIVGVQQLQCDASSSMTSTGDFSTVSLTGRRRVAVVVNVLRGWWQLLGALFGIVRGLNTC